MGDRVGFLTGDRVVAGDRVGFAFDASDGAPVCFAFDDGDIDPLLLVLDAGAKLLVRFAFDEGDGEGASDGMQPFLSSLRT